MLKKADSAELAIESIDGKSVAAPAPPKVAKGWLFNPIIDGLVVANLLWPVMAIVTAQLTNTEVGKSMGFLIAYFLIMPHRWITLTLVFLDPVKFKQNSKKFLLVAVLIVSVATLTQLSMGALAMLLAFDLLWNSWHFAAQHAGIARIYDRMAHPESTSTGMADKLVLRTLIVFAILRMAAVALPTVESGGAWLEWLPVVMAPLSFLDWFVVALPIGLMARDLWQFNSLAWGRIIYLSSITTLYGLMILGVRYEMYGMALGCAAGATFFHSVEYLSIVTWYVKKNKSMRESKPFCYFVPRWAVVLLTFMAACFVSAAMFKQNHIHAWMFMNLVVSYMHYAYDGIIWKRPTKK